MIYVGVDLHLRFCYMTALDASGRILQQGRVGNDSHSLRGYFTHLKNSCEEEQAMAEGTVNCGQEIRKGI